VALWIFHILFIAVASFVAYVILIAVERKQLANLVAMVAIMLGLLTTMQDLTPTLKRLNARIDSIQGTVEKVSNIGQGNNELPMKGKITQYFNGIDHHGIDIAAPEGTPVTSYWKGDVSKVCWDDIYGNMVIVNHGNGVETLYGHMNGLSVKVGYPVVGGAKLGSCGSTGRSSGPHLHWEVRKEGVAVDPMKYLK